MAAPKGEESPRYREAFEHWCRISSGRYNETIFDIVAKEAGVKRRAVEYWYSTFKWKKRYLERFEKAMAIEGDRTIEAMLQTREDYRRIIAKGISQFEHHIDKGNIVVTTVKDFVQLANLDRAILGQPTSEGTNIVIVTAVPRPGRVMAGEVAGVVDVTSAVQLPEVSDVVDVEDE